MRDVRGFSVAEVADQIASSAAAVSSAHQRARATLE
jgi:DNA-directed RNA polymerase specialized sigma24 family protein